MTEHCFLGIVRLVSVGLIWPVLAIGCTDHNQSSIWEKGKFVRVIVTLQLPRQIGLASERASEEVVLDDPEQVKALWQGFVGVGEAREGPFESAGWISVFVIKFEREGQDPLVIHTTDEFWTEGRGDWPMPEATLRHLKTLFHRSE